MFKACFYLISNQVLVDGNKNAI